MARIEVYNIKPSFVDPRGEIINVYEGDVKHISVIRSVLGAVRGNHYHKTDIQRLYCVSGHWVTKWEDVQTGERGETEVVAGQLEVDPPFVAHRVEFLQDSVLVQVSSAPRIELEHKDTFRWDVEARQVA